jgi:predicted ABC-type transport system involved in lysophospholipase L1 biosynthesis ATPase subunit
VSAPVTAATPLAACRRVWLRHGVGDTEVVALAGVDLEIGPDDALALWGRSGSGKTSLLHVLGGLVAPSEGRVEWLGRPLLTLDAGTRGPRRARGIALVFQNGNLLPNFTAVENVTFAAWAAGCAAVDPTPLELLQLVGLGERADNLPAQLSGGEAQRVAIARALAQRPRLLLCDEPTGHLDSDTAARVLDLVDALRRERGFALVLATHDADVAARMDREVDLLDGRIVAGDPLG